MLVTNRRLVLQESQIPMTLKERIVVALIEDEDTYIIKKFPNWLVLSASEPHYFGGT